MGMFVIDGEFIAVLMQQVPKLVKEQILLYQIFLLVKHDYIHMAVSVELPVILQQIPYIWHMVLNLSIPKYT